MTLKKRKKPRVSSQHFDVICQRIAEGEGLKPMCEATDHLPSWRTVLRFVREDEEAYDRYRESRQIQAETMRDQIIKLVETPLPTDPKLAMAEVQRRRLEVDAKDKHIRQMQPSGVRDKQEDAGNSGEITIKWGGGVDVLDAKEPILLEQS